MPISLTCACGAKLEFDDAFAGKVIPCPDCQRPLTATRRAPPPIAHPDQRTSGLAMASLFLSLAGGFTVVGGLVASGLGFFALRKIDQSQGKLGGRSIALAGVLLGLSLTVLTGLVIYLRGPLGIAGLMRSIEWAGALDYTVGTTVTQKTPKNHPLSILRPAGFGKVILNDPNATKRDDILLYSPRDDAYLVVLAHYPVDDNELDQPGARIEKAMELLRESDMVRMILERRIPDRDRGNQPQARQEVPSFLRKEYEGYRGDRHPDKESDERYAGIEDWTVCPFEVALGSRQRVYSFQVYFLKVDGMLLVSAGVARKENFPDLKKTFEEAQRRVHWLR